MTATVNIGTRTIGAGHPCFVIAEIGVNHNGDIETAKKLIDEATQAGAEAVKFQSFHTEALITKDAPKADYQVQTTGEPGSQYKMLKALELNAEQHAFLKTYCDSNGILYLCTPYDYASVDMLADLGVSAYKIASTDTNNVPFLRHIASKGLPIILSTGMSTLAEVEEAVQTLESSGAQGKILILQCTSEYPAPIEDINLRAINTLQKAFGYPVGFSDHTPGVGASPWAVAIGACVIEKHFTLDHTMLGPDHRASIEPHELRQLVQQVRDVERALGDGIKRISHSEAPNKPKMQKSLVVQRDIAAGEIIDANMLTCKRPGTGLAPRYFDQVVGRRAAKSLKADEILQLGSIDWNS